MATTKSRARRPGKTATQATGTGELETARVNQPGAAAAPAAGAADRALETEKGATSKTALCVRCGLRASQHTKAGANLWCDDRKGTFSTTRSPAPGAAPAARTTR